MSTNAFHLSRRRLLAAGGSAALLGLVGAGCGADDAGSDAGAGSAASGGKLTLTMWAWSGAAPAPVELWNKTHPNVQINMERVPGGLSGGYQKMLAAITANNAPDIGQIEYPVLPSFVNTGGLLELSPYGAKDLEKDLAPVMWNQVTFSGQTYAVPRDSGPMGLFYRSDLFDQLKIEPPTSWDDFTTVAAEVRKMNGGKHYLSPFLSDAQWVAALTQQRSSRWFATEGDAWRVNIADDSSLDVAAYWQNLLDKLLVKYENTGSPAFGKELSDGTLLTYPAAIWGQLNFNSLAPQLAGKWRAAALPAWGDSDIGSQYGGSSFAVFKNSKHPKEAAEFVTWLGTDPGALGLLTKFGDYPATVSGQKIPEANQGVKYFGNQDVYPIFRDALNRSDKNASVWGPTTSTVFSDLGDQLTRVSSGATTLPEALKALQEKTVGDMRAQGLTVNV